jgi:hypothetical protein
MMKKITYTALVLSCSLAVSSCTNDDWANRMCDLHGYPKVSPAAEVVAPAPIPPPPPPALEKTLYEREVISPLPPPAPKKYKKKRKVDVREAS